MQMNTPRLMEALPIQILVTKPAANQTGKDWDVNRVYD
jgi:hypothetical protein